MVYTQHLLYKGRHRHYRWEVVEGVYPYSTHPPARLWVYIRAAI